MALQSVGFKASIQLVDEALNKFNMLLDVVGATYATALTNTQTIITDLDAVTDALIKGYRVWEEFAEDTAIYGSAGSEIENVALVTVQLDATEEKYHNFRIPAPVIGLFQGTQGSAKNEVDVSDAALVEYIDNFTDTTGYGVPGPDAIALVSDGEKVKPDNANDHPVIKSGKRIHRASRVG